MSPNGGRDGQNYVRSTVYPPERLAPEGNVAMCSPCEDGLLTWWPSVQDAINHMFDAHAGDTGGRTLNIKMTG